MTELLPMARVAELLGLQARETRLIVRRLRAIAEERGPAACPLFKLGGRWMTSRAALVALVPELVAGDADELEHLRTQLDHQAAAIAFLCGRVEALERQAKGP